MTKGTQAEKTKISNSRFFEGEVISNKMDKTIVVKVYRTLKHPLIGKIIQKFKKYKAHDNDNSAQIGDRVRIAECKPISKDKRTMLVKVLKKSV